MKVWRKKFLSSTGIWENVDANCPHSSQSPYTFTNYDENGIGHCVGNRSMNGYIVYIVSYIIFFITYISIVCCQSVRRKSPGNLIAMAIFTLSLSVWVSSIAVYHDVYWVFMAIGITAALCLGLTLFSFQTKIDFTGKYFMHGLLGSQLMTYKPPF